MYSRVFRRAVPQSLKNLGKSFLKKSFPTVYSRVFWNGLAAHVHSHWGYDDYDFDVVAKCIETIGAESVVDVGCGSGRLFPLFIDQRVEFCGCDISPVALSLARRRFPESNLREVAVEGISDLVLGRRFDLAVSHRVLQHIPPASFDKALRGITTVASAIYVNEMTADQTPLTSSYMFSHNYITEFQNLGFSLVLSGVLDVVGDPPHHWMLFVRSC